MNKYPPGYKKKKRPHGKAGPLYRRLISYIKPFWPMVLLGVFANVIYSLIDAGFTYMMRPFLDKGFINVDIDFIKKSATGCIFRYNP